MGWGDAARRAALSSAFVTLLSDARGGDIRALGALLEAFRPYLLSIACRGLPAHLRGKCDGADVVQETLLEAHRGFAGFDGDDGDDLRIWLRGILKHNLVDLIRRYRGAAKRSVGRERSLDAGLESGDLPAIVVDPYPTPSSASVARESLGALREAMSRLPDDERAVIVLRHFESLPFQEVGQRLDRSPEAARKLCSRALDRLQHMLAVGGDGR